MWWRLPHNPTAYDDDWEDQPGQGPFYQWGLGVLVPLLVLGYGVLVLTTPDAAYARLGTNLGGVNAVAFGVAAASAGVFLHCHYFWGNFYNQAWFAVLGKIIAACGFIAGLGTLIVRVGVLGIA
jgi:hypothetical protein